MIKLSALNYPKHDSSYRIAHFRATVSLMFNYDLPVGWKGEVVGTWNLNTGEIGICMGDYRRAEMVLFQTKAQGFADGNYGNSAMDFVTEYEMAEILNLLWFEVAGRAILGEDASFDNQ